MKKTILITGSGGLIGSQAVKYFSEKNYNIIGIDSNHRKYFFGDGGSTQSNTNALIKKYKNFSHKSTDIRDYKKLERIFKKYKPDAIIHTAAQPSHDWAKKEPITDFTINANGTLNLLELTRLYCKDSPFIFTSTNKVYGDRPNNSFITGKPDIDYKNMIIKEEKTRYEAYFKHPVPSIVEMMGFNNNELASIDETMSIDNCTHSLFGVSKASADLLCQEYGKYFDMNIGIFRGGCLTGPDHSGVELHGFLAYIIKCIKNNLPYKVFGYQGKQVRDNIHAYDLITMFDFFIENPTKGEVYNAGGSRENNISIIETIDKVESYTGKKYTNFEILDDNRVGDHIWYISDISKFKKQYPKWEFRYNIDDIIVDIINNQS